MDTVLKVGTIVGTGALIAGAVAFSGSPAEHSTQAPASDCHPGYSECLKRNAGDYDCAGGSGNGPNYTGRVRVYGSDPFRLDRDNDGWGCE